MQTYDPDWTSLIRPQCEPCPPNAICRFNYEADCKDDYVLVPNPLSFGGLVPLPLHVSQIQRSFEESQSCRMRRLEF